MSGISNLIFGIIFVIVSLFLPAGFFKQLKQRKTFETTSAEITGIEVFDRGYDSDGHRDYDHTVYVKFYGNGKLYEDVKLPYYDSSMKEGELFEIYYNPENPEEIFEAKKAGLVLMAVMFPIFCGVGVLLILKYFGINVL